MAINLFEEEPLTCVSLEAELGLNRGDIISMTTYPGGAVEIETKTALSSTNLDKVKASLAKRGLPRGKKSEKSV